MNRQETNLAILVLFCLTLTLTAFVYWPGLSGDFVFDDFPNLLENQRLQLSTLDMDSLRAAAFSSDSGVLKRPISMLSFALNGYFFGPAPTSFKAVNLVIHLLNGTLIFILTNLVVIALRKTRNTSSAAANLHWLPLLICAAWLLHPLNLTGVLYVVQRMTSLATLFTLCALCLYLFGRLRMLNQQTGFYLILIGLFFFGGLATLSKESGVLTVVYMFVLEFTLFRGKNNSGSTDRKIAGLFVLVIAFPVLVAIGWFYTHPSFMINGYAGRDFTLWERLLTEARALAFYLKLIILPSTSDLGLYHDDFVISHSLFDPPSTIFSVVGLAGLFLTGIYLTKKMPLVSLGILWFFSGHLIESTVIPLELVHEHRNYLADYGILLALFSLTQHLTASLPTNTIRYVCSIIFLALLSGVTMLRATQWGDNVNQQVLELQNHPNSPRAQLCVARIYGNLVLSGKLDHTTAKRITAKAIELFERAAKEDKSNILPDVSLILFSYKMGGATNPRWISTAREKLASRPISPNTVRSLKELVKCQEQQCKLTDAEITQLFHSALNNPSLAKDTNINADITSIYATYIINHKHDYQQGRVLFQKAVDIAPHVIQYRLNLLNLLMVLKEYSAAQYQLDAIKEQDTLDIYKKDTKPIQKDLLQLTGLGFSG